MSKPLFTASGSLLMWGAGMGALTTATVTAVAWMISGTGASGVATSGIVFGIGALVGCIVGVRLMFKIYSMIDGTPAGKAAEGAVVEAHALLEALNILRKYDKDTALRCLQERWTEAQADAEKLLMDDDVGADHEP